MIRFTNAACLGPVILTMGICIMGQDSVPPVYLTHSVIYVSSETYEELKASPLIRDEFSAFREATTHVEGGALSYTGLYLTGMHTYFEIFKTGPSEVSHKIEPPGRISFAMWIDHRTQLPLIRERLSGASIRTRRNAQNQPWYDAIGGGEAQSEGVTSFVAGLYPDGVVRSNRSYQPDRLLHDLIACTVTVGTAERETLVETFRAYGYTVHDDGAQTVASGPEFRLTMLQERPNEPRTASFEVTLNREKDGNPSYRLGSSELRFDGKKATFHFAFIR